jgi:hypothetical protein
MPPKPPHLLVALSANGFGHVAQTSIVLTELRRIVPDLRLTIQSGYESSRIALKIDEPFDRVAVEHDFGFIMQQSAMAVDLEASIAAYRRIGAEWDALVGAQAKLLTDRHVDLVLSNISFIALAGARRAGIPGVALASLDWADLLGRLAPGRRELVEILPRMADAYHHADLVLQPFPCVPMTGARHREETPPLAEIGRNRRAEVAARFGVADGERLIMVALGGLGDAPPVEHWPEAPGIRWIVPHRPAGANRLLALDELDMPWVEALCSSDAFIGKPGYGSSANAAANAKPFLFTQRGDWPEEPYVVDWLQQHTNCREIAMDRLWAGDVLADLAALWAAPARPPVSADGGRIAAERLAGLLGRG